jgi:hypothetical protein
MKLPHAHRSWPGLLLLITAAMMPLGCSKSPTKPSPPKPIAHADADDIAQVLATTMSADNGGWYYTIKVIAESLSTPPPNLLAVTAPASRWSVPLTTRFRTLNDFKITKDSKIVYNFQVGYVRANGLVTTNRDTTSQELAAYVATDVGGIFSDANGVTGNYGLRPLQIHGATDSSFTVDGLTADTLEFAAFMEDSVYGVVHSTITPNAGRNWYHPDNIVDWTLRIPRSKLTSSPYPMGVDSEVNWIIEARSLNANGDRDLFVYDLIVEARMTFDGTEEATLMIANVTLEPDWAYFYKVNINTGRFTRTN